MISVQIKNADYTENVLKRLQSKIGILSEPLRTIADIMRDSGFAKQFSTEGYYGAGRRWTGLTKGTKSGRTKLGYGTGPILDRNGELKKSWTKKSSPGHSQKVGRTSVALGSTLRVGVHYLGTIHHFGASFMHPGSSKLQAWDGVVVHGTKAHKIDIPARPIMGYDGNVPDDLRLKMNNELELFIDVFTRAVR